GADTDPAIFDGFSRFADRVLGKRVIRAKDTPGFISTRIGIYSMSKTIRLAIERGLTVEQVDYLTGPLIGRPKSGTFRLADVVGLDVTVKIMSNLKRDLPGDADIQQLELPERFTRLVSEGNIGAKCGSGFYSRDKSGTILALDFKTGEYSPAREPE